MAEARQLAIFAAGYFLALRLAEQTYGSLAVPSPFWLPDSVFLCALLLVPRSRWWLYALALWTIRLAVGVVPGTPMWFQVVSIANDTAKGLGAAWLLQRFAGPPFRLLTLREFLLFLGIAAGVFPVLSALAAAPTRYALGDPFWRAAYQWFLGDSLTQVVVTPAILYWSTLRWRPGQGAELLLMSAGLVGALFVGLAIEHLSYSLMFLYLPVPFLIWAAVRLGPFGTANALTLTAIVSMVSAVGGTGAFAGESPDNAALSIQLFLLVVGASLLSFAILMTEREALLAREAELSLRLIDAQDKERSRIASELHDDIGQQMAVLLVGLEEARRSSGTPGAANTAQLDKLVEAASQMSSDLHDLSHQLHPLRLNMLSIDGALRSLCRDFSTHYGLDVQLECRGVPKDLRRDISLCFYRIAQEALHNIVKYSGVNQARIELAIESDRATLTIADAGRGFDTRQLQYQSGLGLIGMRERLRALDGDLTIDAAPAAGTRLRASVRDSFIVARQDTASGFRPA